MSWWKKLRTARTRGAKESGPWCDACRRRVPGPVTKAPPPGVLYDFYVGAPGRVRTTSVREACDDCWRRHRELTAEGEADFRRAHPVEKYVAALRDPDRTVREEASRVLMALRDPRAVGPLIAAVRSEMRHPRAERAYLTQNLMFALSRTGGDEARSYLVSLLHAPASWRDVPRPDFYPLVPAEDWITPALGDFGDTVMLPPLLALLAADRPVMLRRGAARHLDRITQGTGTQWWLGGPVACAVTAEGRTLAAAALRVAAEDADGEVREPARRALDRLAGW